MVNFFKDFYKVIDMVLLRNSISLFEILVAVFITVNFSKTHMSVMNIILINICAFVLVKLLERTVR